jgi:predicted nucleotide-binding protein
MKGAHVKPRVFVGSSSEGCAIAKAVCLQLKRHTEPTLWSRDVFLPSNYPLETLEEQITNHSFAVLVASPDDALIKREKLYPVMRDNLLLEFGLFAGALGRRHTFFICPNTPKLALPSDLLGIITATYNASCIPNKNADSDRAINQAVKSACRQVLRVINNEVANIRHEKVNELRKLKRSQRSRAAKKVYELSSRLFTSSQHEALTSWSDPAAFKKIKAIALQEINTVAQSLTAETKLLGLERHLEQLQVATTAAVRELPYLSVAQIQKTMKTAMKFEEDPRIVKAQEQIQKKGIEIRRRILMERLGHRFENAGAAESNFWNPEMEELVGLERDIQGAIMNEVEGNVQQAFKVREALERDILDTIKKETKADIENLMKIMNDGIMQEIDELMHRVADRHKRWWNKHWPRLEQGSKRMNEALINVIFEVGLNQRGDLV